jgi:hypothetical protein
VPVGWSRRTLSLMRRDLNDLTCNLKEKQMLGTILIVVLVLMLIGVLPTWTHSRSWGYAPSGGLGLILLILVVLLLMGRL